MFNHLKMSFFKRIAILLSCTPTRGWTGKTFGLLMVKCHWIPTFHVLTTICRFRHPCKVCSLFITAHIFSPCVPIQVPTGFVPTLICHRAMMQCLWSLYPPVVRIQLEILLCMPRLQRWTFYCELFAYSPHLYTSTGLRRVLPVRHLINNKCGDVFPPLARDTRPRRIEDP